MSLPGPEPGLVIAYNYLWHREFEDGAQDGRKTRPAVIVLATARIQDDATSVVVLPITHAAPRVARSGVAIPGAVQLHLGLDSAPSWVVVSEGNEFVWPGYDLRRVPGSQRFDYGYLPPRFFQTIVTAFIDWSKRAPYRATPRD